MLQVVARPPRFIPPSIGGAIGLEEVRRTVRVRLEEVTADDGPLSRATPVRSAASKRCPFGLLIFVVGSLLIANAWAVVDAKFATDAAARQAVRTFVEGDDPDVRAGRSAGGGPGGRRGPRARSGSRPSSGRWGRRPSSAAQRVDLRGRVRGASAVAAVHRRLRTSAVPGALHPQRAGRPVPQRRAGRSGGVRVTRATSRERGSVLMLMPAGVLVVLLLGAIAFDLSLVFLRQRQASSLAADVRTTWRRRRFDEEAFRRDGEFRLDPDRGRDLGADLVAASDLGDLIVDVEVAVVGPDEVTVRVVVQVDYVFARAVPARPMAPR